MLTHMAWHPCPHSKGIHNSSCLHLCSKGEKCYTETKIVAERERKNDQSMILKIIFKYDSLLCCCWVWLIYVRQSGHWSEAHRYAFYSPKLHAVSPCCNLLQLNDKLLFRSSLNESVPHLRKKTCQVFVHLAGILTHGRARKRSRGRAPRPSINTPLTHLLHSQCIGIQCGKRIGAGMQA